MATFAGTGRIKVSTIGATNFIFLIMFIPVPLFSTVYINLLHILDARKDLQDCNIL